jgi:hypothetical protein
MMFRLGSKADIAHVSGDDCYPSESGLLKRLAETR